MATFFSKLARRTVDMSHLTISRKNVSFPKRFDESTLVIVVSLQVKRSCSQMT